jgi:tetratricopeptide (TPR) repeat protein
MTEANPSNTLMEAIAAARAGDRVKARQLLSRLLKSDSGNPEYWIWMSSVVGTEKEKQYCLESAKNLDPTNRAVLRGLLISGARKPGELDLSQAVKISRKQAAAVSKAARKKPKVRVRRQFKLNLRFVAIVTMVILVVIIGGGFLISLLQPRSYTPAPTLPPATITPSFTPIEPSATPSPIPASTRVLRTSIPSDLAGTPLVFLVPATPTETPIWGITPRPNIEAYQAGINALIDGDYDSTIDFMDQVLALDDSIADAFYFKGEAYRLLGLDELASDGEQVNSLFGNAINAYDKATLLAPDYAPAYLGRGRVLLQRTLLNKNLEDLRLEDLPNDFQRAIEADPLFTTAYLEKANYLKSLRLWKTMEETLQTALDAGISEPMVYIRLSEAQFNRGNFEAALENAVEGSAADPTLLDGYLALGWALNKNELYPAAIAPLETYVLYRQDDHRGFSQLGRAEVEIGDYESAQITLARAMELNERYSPTHLALGWLNIALEDFEAAYDHFQRAERYGVESFDLVLGTATALYNLGEYQESLRFINRAIEIGNEEDLREDLELKVAEGYALRALIYENNPELINDAILNWQWILTFTYVREELRELAMERLQELTGGVPTLPPTNTPVPSRTPTPTPSLTPTITTTPATATPSASPGG